MGAQQIGESAFLLVDPPAQRTDEKEMRRAAAGAGKRHRRVADLLQRVCQAERVARVFRAGGVGEIFPLARDGHGEEARENRRNDDQKQKRDRQQGEEADPKTNFRRGAFSAGPVRSLIVS